MVYISLLDHMRNDCNENAGSHFQNTLNNFNSLFIQTIPNSAFSFLRSAENLPEYKSRKTALSSIDCDAALFLVEDLTILSYPAVVPLLF